MENSSRNTRSANEDLRRLRDPSPGTRAAKEPRLQLEAPVLSLPKGGGAIRSIDEKFDVNPSNGTVAFSLPLPFSPGRNGFLPPVRLSYNSGVGNSLAGLGWSIDMPSIRRRTDRRLPRYRGDDTFLLQGCEELVPSSKWNVDHWDPEVTQSGLFSVRRYRPRIEGDFFRIERIAHPALGTWWRVTSRDNVTTFFGLDDASRVADPGSAENVFEWLPAVSFDDLGNCLVYEYKPEDLSVVPLTLSEANRHAGTATFANKHLKRLRYGNRTPYVADEASPYRPAALPTAFLFHGVFDYGEHDPARPTLSELPGRFWPLRP